VERGAFAWEEGSDMGLRKGHRRVLVQSLEGEKGGGRVIEKELGCSEKLMLQDRA